MNRERDLSVFLGDATGHGVIAAFITMMVHLGLAGIRRDLSTDEVMRRLNSLLAGRTAANSMTGVLFRVTAGGRMSVTHAGGKRRLEHLHGFSGGAACGDDLTVVCLEYRGAI